MGNSNSIEREQNCDREGKRLLGGLCKDDSFISLIIPFMKRQLEGDAFAAYRTQSVPQRELIHRDIEDGHVTCDTFSPYILHKEKKNESERSREDKERLNSLEERLRENREDKIRFREDKERLNGLEERLRIRIRNVENKTSNLRNDFEREKRNNKNV